MKGILSVTARFPNGNVISKNFSYDAQGLK